MISKATIEKIFSTVRVEEIISEYIQLKRSGSNLKGFSPFVEEKTPSFVVSPAKQIWKDFSSGKAGSAISFLMEIESFSYPEALRYVAKKYGIEIEENQKQITEEERQKKTEKELLFKIHEVAQSFFEKQLWESNERISTGLSYLKERELKEEIIKKFRLGYSPEQNNIFTLHAIEKGYSKDILEKSGLSVFSSYVPEGVDRFRERIIFPIHSYSGRVLGFGARIIKSNTKAAKYLNSPETEIYHKSNILYGLFQSKQAISKENNCLLVEGYMDVIMLHQSGIENVVASSGTSLTKEQIKLIKRLTENVSILFDGDPAGIKASFRSIDLLLAENINIRVILFPEGHDPDSFTRNNSRNFVKNFIHENAKDFISFKAEILLEEAKEDPIKQAEAIKDIIKSVSFIENRLKQEIYIRQISIQFKLSEKALFQELNIQQQITLKQNKKPQKNISVEIIKEEKYSSRENNNSLLILEEKLIELILKYGSYILNKKNKSDEMYQTTVAEEIIRHFREDNYNPISDVNQRIISEIENGLSNNKILSTNFLLGLMDEEITTKVAKILIDPHHTSDWSKHNIFFKNEEEVIEKVIQDVTMRHKREYIMKMIKDLNNNTSNDETYKKIIKLNQLKNKIDEKLYRIL